MPSNNLDKKEKSEFDIWTQNIIDLKFLFNKRKWISIQLKAFVKKSKTNDKFIK